MSYEKALSLISGGGSGVTVFPVIQEGEEAFYVEVSESVLFDALKTGTVIFRKSYNVENDGFAGITDYHIVYANASHDDVRGSLGSIYFDEYTSNAKGKSWVYNEGSYYIN